MSFDDSDVSDFEQDSSSEDEDSEEEEELQEDAPVGGTRAQRVPKAKVHAKVETEVTEKRITRAAANAKDQKNEEGFTKGYQDTSATTRKNLTSEENDYAEDSGSEEASGDDSDISDFEP